MKSCLVFTVDICLMTVLHVGKQFHNIWIAAVYHSFWIIGEGASSWPESRESRSLPQWKVWLLKDTWLNEYLFWHSPVQAWVDVGGGLIGGIRNVPMTWRFRASCSVCSRISRAVLWSAEETWQKCFGLTLFDFEWEKSNCLFIGLWYLKPVSVTLCIYVVTETHSGFILCLLNFSTCF